MVSRDKSGWFLFGIDSCVAGWGGIFEVVLFIGLSCYEDDRVGTFGGSDDGYQIPEFSGIRHCKLRENRSSVCQGSNIAIAVVVADLTPIAREVTVEKRKELEPS